MCNLNCQINSQVGGDHAYCDCECHKDTLPAVPPSRKRRKLTQREPDDGDSLAESELSNDELDTDFQLWSTM